MVKKANKVEMLVAKSKVQNLVKGGDMRFSQQCFEPLSAKVAEVVTAAMSNAKADKRKTVKPKDFEDISIGGPAESE